MMLVPLLLQVAVTLGERYTTATKAPAGRASVTYVLVQYKQVGPTRTEFSRDLALEFKHTLQRILGPSDTTRLRYENTTEDQVNCARDEVCDVIWLEESTKQETLSFTLHIRTDNSRPFKRIRTWPLTRTADEAEVDTNRAAARDFFAKCVGRHDLERYSDRPPC